LVALWGPIESDGEPVSGIRFHNTKGYFQ